MKAVECSVRADLLLEKAADTQLGPKTKNLLLEQAQSTRDAVTQLQDHLNKKYVPFPKNKNVLSSTLVIHDIESECSLSSSSTVQLEMMRTWWERFSSESEAFSLWVNEREKELEAVGSTSSLEPLDKQIRTVEVCPASLSFIKMTLHVTFITKYFCYSLVKVSCSN